MTRSAANSEPQPTYAFGEALCERVRANLAAFVPETIAQPGLRRAAVALTLLPDEAGRGCFVLTRRHADLRSHAGQWALPGGRLEGSERAEEAARRELLEEVGLEVGEQAVLGRLDDFATRSRHLITPLVVWAGREAGRRLRPNPGEVEAAYRVPLAELDRPENPHLHFIPQSERPVLSLALIGTRVFAPTAALLFQFREVALHGRSTRVAHFEQPLFAWQ